jgi:hypothetical protein
LLGAVVGVVLLAALTLPLWGATKERSRQLICLNNLRLLGAAFQVWSRDHDGNRPCRVLIPEGGTRPVFGNPRPGNAWFEFGVLSNELASPALLVCPADQRTTRVAREFSTNPDGGFYHAAYRANALSYFLGTDAYKDIPRIVLAGDRDLRVDSVRVNCSAGFNEISAVLRNSTQAAWTNAVHPRSGNLLFNDGSAEQTTSEGLRGAFRNESSSSRGHLLMPR